MLSVLYKIIIFPIYQLIELIYYLLNGISGNTIFSILGISVSITLLCLPLYNIAEKWQEQERNTQKKLKPGVERIKKAFNGDEQYMILSTFYRQHHYHPIMALRSSFGLLIQIPFFIAAYTFLSHNPDLQGQSFWFIKDLAKPDSLITFSKFSINILPILMTLINIGAGTIYTKGFAFKDKLQLYLMAFVFLVLLYNSPSGLVFYWTMNNVFSLVKNIFYKLKNPKKVFYIFCCVAVFLLQVFLLKNLIAKYNVTHSIPKYRTFIFAILFLFYTIPEINKIISKIPIYIYSEKSKQTILIFLLSTLSIALLSVICIQNAVSTSVSEFSFIGNITNPNQIISNSFFVCLGFCFVWPTCIFFLFSNKVKKILSFGAFTILIVEIINVFFFSSKFGNMSNIFVLENVQSTLSKQSIINLLIMIFVILSILVSYKFSKQKYFLPVSSILFISFIILSITNKIKINKNFDFYTKNYNIQKKQIQDFEPIFNFSKENKNIVLLFLDRASADFVNKIFLERPELYNQFDGFTFYDNTASFGMHTIYCGSSIFGGYEYTPLEINKRKDEQIKYKQQEAAHVLPQLLVDNNFEVVFTNPNDTTWLQNINFEASFQDDKKITIYDLISKYELNFYKDNNLEQLINNANDTYILRNAPLYALLCKSPTLLHKIIAKEDYWSNASILSNLTTFVSHFSNLYYLPQLTEFSGKGQKAFLMINLTTHSPYGLNPPDYKIEITNDSFSKLEKHYSTNIVSFEAIGKWLDLLKQNDVYDNTRIILLSDHGIGDFDNYNMQEEAFHPILFVKDFNEHGKLKTNSSFQTTADIPFFVLQDIVEQNKMINPYTKKLMKQDKDNGIVVTTSHDFLVTNQEDNTFVLPNEYLFIIKDYYNNAEPYVE